MFLTYIHYSQLNKKIKSYRHSIFSKITYMVIKTSTFNTARDLCTDSSRIILLTNTEGNTVHLK